MIIIMAAAGDAVEPMQLIVMMGSNLAEVTLHAHAAGQYILLRSPAESSVPVELDWGPEVG